MLVGRCMICLTWVCCIVQAALVCMCMYLCMYVYMACMFWISDAHTVCVYVHVVDRDRLVYMQVCVYAIHGTEEALLE